MKSRFPVPLCLCNSVIIMPERLAKTDAFTQVTEMVGSGPFRFLPTERVAGARAAYARFEGYVPRGDGPPGTSAGPKVANVDRVEWHVIPDPSTAAAAMLAGEMDWWGPTPDFLPQLRASSKLRLERIDTLGTIRIMRFNHLHPPFDNPAIRRAILPAIEQAMFMTAVTEDRALWRDGVGVFTPGTPMATTAGIEVLANDLARARALLAQSGYRGEPVLALHAADTPEVSSNTLVGVDLLKRIGFNIELQTMDWGTLMQRRAKMDPPASGGWNLVFTGLTGSGTIDPSGHIGLRGNGRRAWAGWPTSERLEQLRDAWFAAPSLPAQQAICVEIQKQVWQDVPYIPLGQRFGPYAFNNRVRNVARGFPQFYNLSLA